MESLKISILTPSYNQGVFIEKNILSVINQNYSNFEHIIIDGGSTDNTLQVLKRYPHLKWISEKDKGQADALRKGLEIATGDIIGWINSDDYFENEIFEEVCVEFQNNEIKWIVGNLKFTYFGKDKEIYSRSPEVNYTNLIKNPDIVRQQSAFYRREFVIENGGFSPEFYMVMDFDLWIRLSKVSSPKMADKLFAYFVLHPEQKTSPKNILRQTKEILLIYTNEKVPFKYHLLLKFKKYKSYFKNRIKSLIK